MNLTDQKFAIRIPASSANLGPGFDSMGVALDLYLDLEVETSEHWECYSRTIELQEFPTDDRNFICQIAIQTAKKYGKELAPCRIVVDSDIPLARGLGSSAAAIVAGIELANYVGDLELTQKEKLLLATEIEGHPDNVGASLYGGLVIGSYQNNEVDILSMADIPMEMVAVIPQEILLTKESRGVLPTDFSYPEAVQASSTANLLVAALLCQNWELAGKMMDRDRFHQPYRKPLIPFYQEIDDVAKDSGAFGIALSGAGPTVLCFCELGKGKELANVLEGAFPDMKVKLVNIDSTGSSVKKCEKCL
ncbi:homoserine kinase [Bacillus sp. MRMR6]|uniref:homoserine kinase n=1 Tax=Bacillus sp. MRMR6 TaxID=1928617 RepID=UPI0009530C9E|nr:homoserine kinase [Bacillus sp. MRMR6]OLS38389.1 homoserine kinase [Bacillus sp. MRMR6]